MSAPGQPVFIYLIGLAGTGKLTIARAMQRHFEALLVDNHLVNNVVFSLIDPDGVTPLPPAVWTHVSQVRSVVLSTIRTLSRPGRSFIFTNELLEGRPQHLQYFSDVAALAATRGARLVPVLLHIEAQELARRVGSPGRAEAYKDIDAEGALRRAAEFRLLRPVGVPCLELDVTRLSADAAAVSILRDIALLD